MNKELTKATCAVCGEDAPEEVCEVCRTPQPRLRCDHCEHGYGHHSPKMFRVPGGGELAYRPCGSCSCWDFWNAENRIIG